MHPVPNDKPMFAAARSLDQKILGIPLLNPDEGPFWLTPVHPRPLRTMTRPKEKGRKELSCDGSDKRHAVIASHVLIAGKNFASGTKVGSE